MKKIISIILAGIITFSVAYADSVGHGDLAAPSNWAMGDIETAEGIGILDGFKVPWTNAITREEFCTLSYNMLNFNLMPSWEVSEPFADTDNLKVAGLYNLGIIKGRSDQSFDPDGKITREEAATILHNMSLALGIDTDSIISTLVAYIDDEDISSWAKNNVYNMRKIDVMCGTDKGFMPKENITVEQAVSVVVRLHNYYISMPGYTQGFADILESKIPDSTNYVISPFSVKLALLMTANGADGETKKEICDVLGVSDLDGENERIKELLSWYSESELLKLDVSNSIWMNEDKTSQEFSAEYKEKIKDIFSGESGIVNNDTAAEKINGWVDDKTNGKITKIINEENSDFWAMLVNAVYFKGRWLKEFSKEATQPDIFTSMNGVETEMDFMNKISWMNYGKKGGVEIIELPYLTREDVFDDEGNYVETKRLENLDISMYLVMSDGEIMPETAVKTIMTQPKFVSLSVPKFTVEYKQNLADILKEMGVKKAFQIGSAEFEPMFTHDTMWITSLMHKTYINVDEEGTEAAAVTSVGMAGNSLPPEPIVVKFNKPFSFVICDKANGEVLFVGRFAYGTDK